MGRATGYKYTIGDLLERKVASEKHKIYSRGLLILGYGRIHSSGFVDWHTYKALDLDKDSVVELAVGLVENYYLKVA